MLEAIHVQKQYRGLSSVPTSQRGRLNKPFIQQHPVRQIGEGVVVGQMGHFFRQFPRAGDIVENQHCAGYLTVAVVNGSR